MEKRLIDLEIKYAFQEDLIEKLNQVIIEQGKKITYLEEQWSSMREQVSRESPIKDLRDEEPPPHY